MKLASFELYGGDITITVGSEYDIGCLSPGIQYHKTYVVSCGGVLGSDVAETCHQV